jgi:hypothetical protein
LGAFDGELALHLSTVKAGPELDVVFVGSGDIEDAGSVTVPTDAFRLNVREAQVGTLRVDVGDTLTLTALTGHGLSLGLGEVIAPVSDNSFILGIIYR